MEFKKKSDVMGVLKRHNYGNAESDVEGGSRGMNRPYRDRDGRVIKAIRLFRTSPVTFSDTGRRAGIERVDGLVADLEGIGRFRRVSEFGFVGLVQSGPRRALKVTGSYFSLDGLVYEQTFHFLGVTIEEVRAGSFDIDGVGTHEDPKTEVHGLTDEYLDSILDRYGR